MSQIFSLRFTRTIRYVAIGFALLAVSAFAFAATRAHADTPHVVINEFSAAGSSDWVELYNPTASAVDVSGWQLQDFTFSGSTPTGTATTTIAASSSVPAGGFLAIDTGTHLNADGDVITLFDGSENQIDQVIYGTVTGYTADVTAPTSGQSAGRSTDGGSTWQVFDNPTEGFSNVPPTLSTPADGATVTSNPPTLSWSAVSGATSYTVQVASDSGFTTVLGGTSGSATSYTPSGSLSNGTWYWRVAAGNSNGTGAWSTTGSFVVSAASVITITNDTELCNAVQHQSDGQTWNIAAGDYAISQSCGAGITAGGAQGSAQTGWYFPITANDLTINGAGDGWTDHNGFTGASTTIYGTGFTQNGAWASQDLIAIFGNNVTLNGLTVMDKVEPNKAIEVMGADSTLKNIHITHNTLTDQSEFDQTMSAGTTKEDAEQWNGSIYYNDATGTNTLSMVQIDNGGVSVHSPNATIDMTNVWLTYTSNIDSINDYRINMASVGHVVDLYPQTITYSYHVYNTLDNLQSAVKSIGDPAKFVANDFLWFGSDATATQEVTLTHPVTIWGNGYTLRPDFAKSSNENNAVLGINSDNVSVNSLNIDGTYGTDLHGINVYESKNVLLNTVRSRNNDYDGIVVNGSQVTAKNLTTSNDGWGGVDVDQGSGVTTPAIFTVEATSTQSNEPFDIYVDSLSKGSVVDVDHQYVEQKNVVQPGDAVYTLKSNLPAAPTGLFAKFQYDKTYTVPNGATLNKTASTTGNNLLLGWTAPSGTVKGYHILVTYPDKSTKLVYQGSNNWTWLVSQAAFGSQQGKYTFQVEVVEPTGVSALSAPFVLSYDTKSPTAEFDPVPPTYVNQNFSVSGIANDNVALSGVFFDVRDPSDTTGNAWRSGCVSGTMTTIWSNGSSTANVACTINISNLIEGKTYTLRIHAGDYAGYGSAGQQQDLIVDRTRPNGTITAPTDGSTQTGAFTITGTATDTTSGVDHVNVYVTKLKNDGTFDGYVVDKQLATWDANTGTFTYDVSGLADGTYTVKADIFDKAGNDHFASPSPKITVQNILPQLVITAPATDGDYATSTYAFAATYNSGSGSAPIPTTYDWAVRSGANASCQNGTTVAGNVDGKSDTSIVSGNAFSASLDTTAWQDGSYCFVVNDLQGERSVRLFTVDNTMPIAPTLVSPLNNMIVNGASVTQTWSDPDSTIDHFVYESYNDANATSLRYSQDFASTTFSKTATNVSNASYWWRVEAVDAAGNIGVSPLWKLTVNDNAPTTPVSSVTTNAATNITLSDATLNGTIGPVGASSYLFWVSTSTIDTSNPNVLPAGAVRTVAYATSTASSANASFSVPLSSLTTAGVPSNLAPITPDTTYYYVAWANISGTWVPGNEVSFTTMPEQSVSSTVTIYPTDLVNDAAKSTTPESWYFWNDDAVAQLVDNSLGSLVTGPAGALTTGSALISATNGAHVALASNGLGTVKVNQITGLSYKTYVTSGSETYDLIFDVSDGSNTDKLVYAPAAPVVTNTWQTWTPTSDSANDWWYSGTLASVTGCSSLTRCSWSKILSTLPNNGNVTIDNGTYLEVAPTDSFSGNVDDFTITTNDGSTIATTTYDFEPASGGGAGGTGGTGTGGGTGSSGLLGDLNHDGQVNFLDFAIMAADMNETGTGLIADLNNDGTVDASDLLILFANWTV